MTDKIIEKAKKKGLGAIILAVILIMGLMIAIFSLGLIDLTKKEEVAHAATAGYSQTPSATCTVTLSAAPSGQTFYTYTLSGSDSAGTQTAATWKTGTYATDSTGNIFYLYGQTSQNKATQTNNCAAMAQGWEAATQRAKTLGKATAVTIKLMNNWGATIDDTYQYFSYFSKTGAGFRGGALSLNQNTNIILDLNGFTLNRNLYVKANGQTYGNNKINSSYWGQVINTKKNAYSNGTDSGQANPDKVFVLKDSKWSTSATADATGVTTGVGRITGGSSGYYYNGATAAAGWRTGTPTTTSNTNYEGGGLAIHNATFTYQSGAICFNTADVRSGIVTSYSVVNMTGGVIAHNTSNGTGAGMWVGNTQQATVTGGLIAYNSAIAGSSGGIHVAANIITLNVGGTTIIRNNTVSANGAGILINSGNSATIKAVLNLYGTAQIYDNYAANIAGGVYMVHDTKSVFNIKDNPLVKNNKSGGNTGNNVDDDVYFIANAKVNVYGALTNTTGTPRVGVGMKTMGTFTTGFQTYNAGKSANAFFFSNNLAYQVNVATTLEGQLITSGTPEPAWNQAINASRASGGTANFDLTCDWTAVQVKNSDNAVTNTTFNETPGYGYGTTNKSATGTGCLCVPSDAKIVIDLKGHTIDRGLVAASKQVAGGEVIHVFGTLTIKDTVGGGKIIGGDTTGNGGGIHVTSAGVLTVYGGEISGNIAKGLGGGICFNSTGVCTLTPNAATSNVVIQNNTATGNGGGLWVKATATVNTAANNAYSLKIENNKTSAYGGGVYMEKNTSNGFNIGYKNIYIRNNRSTVYGLSNLHITEPNNTQLKITAALTANTATVTNSEIGISFAAGVATATFGKANTASWVTNAIGSATVPAILKCDQKIMNTVLGDTSTGNLSTGYKTDTTMAQKWTELVTLSKESGQLEMFNISQDWTPEGVGTNTTYFGSGTGFTSAGVIEVPSGAKIRINLIGGAKINRNLSALRENGTVIQVNGGTLTIAGTGVITGGKTTTATEGGAITVVSGTCTLSGTGITVTNNKATNGGAGYVASGTLSSGATITKNTATSGGAFYVAGGTLTISGGTIGDADSAANKNSATNGGAIYANAGTLNLNGGTISYNTATESGGGVYSKIKITQKATIKNNSAKNGGGIYIAGGTTTMSAGAINNNTASANGGGIYVAGGGFSITAGTMTGNKATTSGGAVYMAAGTFTFGTSASHAPAITGNSSPTGGGVYVASGVTVNTAGKGTIVDNTTTASGSVTNNLHLVGGVKINVTAALTSGTTSIGITVKTLGTFTNNFSAKSGMTATIANLTAIFPMDSVTDMSNVVYGYTASNAEGVVGKTIANPTFVTSALTYSGSAQKLASHAATNTGYTVTVAKDGGTASAVTPVANGSVYEVRGTDAGSYVVTYTLKAGYLWNAEADRNFNLTKSGKVTMNRKAVTTDPSAATGLTYTGSALTIVKNYDSNTMTLTSGAVSQTNAGTYEVKITPKANYQWKSATDKTGTLTFNVTVARKQIAKPTAATGLTYTGAALTIVSGYDSTTMTLDSGKDKQTNAGSYTTQISPKANYSWASDGATGALSFSVTIARKGITQPTGLEVTYNGVAQNLVNGYDSATMTLTSGSLTGINAQTYTLKFTPGSNYQWDSGSSTAAARTVTAKINPKPLTLYWDYTGSTANGSTHEFVYNGAKQGPRPLTNDACNTATEAEQVAFNFDAYWQTEVNTSSPIFTVTATIKQVTKGNARAENYTIGGGATSEDCKITPRPVTITAWDYTGATLTSGTYHYVYNNTDQSPKVGTYTGQVTGVTLVFTYENTIKNATTTAKKAKPVIANVDGGMGKAYNYKIAETSPDSENFVVDKANISNGTLAVTTAADTIIYKGAAWKPAYKLTFLNAATTDYTAAYANNTNAGTGKITLTAKDNSTNFTGTKEVNFTILKADIANVTVTSAADATKPISLVYQNAEICPTGADMVVKLNSTTTLTYDTDFTLSATNNKLVGDAAVVTLTAKGTNYQGTKSVNFSITGATLTDTTASIGESPRIPYDGNAYGLTFGVTGFIGSDTAASENMTVKWSLSEDGPFTTEQAKVTDAGVHDIYYEVTFTNYLPIKSSKTVTIDKIPIVNSTVDVIKDYDGEEIGLTIDLTGMLDADEGKTLEQLGATVFYGYTTATVNAESNTTPITYARAARTTGRVEDTDEYTTYRVYYKIRMTNYYVQNDENLTTDVICSNLITIKKPKLTDITPSVTVPYDGGAHTVEIALGGMPGGAYDEAGKKVMYAIDQANAEAGTGVATPITITDVGEITVWYRVETENFQTLISSQTVTIVPRNIKLYGDIEFIDADQNYVYTGQEIKPGIRVNDIGTGDNALLCADTVIGSSNYNITYTNNINASLSLSQYAVVSISGIGNYTGVIEKKFEIKKAKPNVVKWAKQKSIEQKVVYAGETLKEVERDTSEAVVVNSADSSVSVLGLGYFQWVNLDEKIQPETLPAATTGTIPNFKASYALTFVINNANYIPVHDTEDTENFISAMVEVEVAWKYVEIRETFPTEWKTNYGKEDKSTYYPVLYRQKSFDYRTSGYKTFFDLTFGDGNEPEAGTDYAGYAVNVSAYVIQGTEVTVGIVDNKLIDVTYVEKGDIDYVVYHVLMDSEGNYPFTDATSLGDIPNIIAVELAKGDDSRIKQINKKGRTNGEVTTEITKIKVVDPEYDELELQYFTVDNLPSQTLYPRTGTVNGDGSSEFFVFYRRQTFVLTYNSTGGKLPAGKNANVNVYYKQVFHNALNIEPTQTGYDFIGWYNNYANRGQEGYEVNFGTDRMPAAAVTIYAFWRASEYTLTLDTNYIDLENSWPEKNGEHAFVADLSKIQSYVIKTGTKETKLTSINGDGVYTGKFSIDSEKITIPKPSTNAYNFLAWVDENGVSYNAIGKGTTGNIKLTAMWEPKTYMITLNGNNGKIYQAGKGYATRQIKLTNGQPYPDVIFPVEGEDNLYEPRRDGYVFECWTIGKGNGASDLLQYNNQNGEPVPNIVSIVKALTLYAKWVPVTYELVLESPNMSFIVNIERPGEEDPIAPIKMKGNEDDERIELGGIIKVGDNISITFIPFIGYNLGTITYDATSQKMTNGRKFTVTPALVNNKGELIIKATSSAIRYSITYNYNGGSETNDWKIANAQSKILKSYDVTMDTLYLPGAKYDIDGELIAEEDRKDMLVRTGYLFDGWVYDLYADEDAKTSIDRFAIYGEIDEDEDEDEFDDDPNNNTLIGNITLYAVWSAAPQEIIFHDNYIPEGETVENTNVSQNMEQIFQITGKTLEIEDYKANVSFNDKTYNLGIKNGFRIVEPTVGVHGRTGFEFAGWATSSDGAVVYPASYIVQENSVTGEEEYQFVGVDGVYTVKPSENHLYAKWRVANAQYVIINVTNNDCVYGDSEDGIVLKPNPRYEYKVSGEDIITMFFNWYYINGESVEVVGTEVYVDGVRQDAKQVSGGIDSRLFYSQVAEDKEEVARKVNLTVKNVKDSGRYFCLFYVRGQDNSPVDDTNGKISSWSQASGEIQVFINKGTLSDVSLKDATIVYDGDEHTLSITHAQRVNGQSVDDTEEFLALIARENITLNTGAYYSDAGTYEITVSFTVPEDANYMPISPLTATLTIEKRMIDGITWVSNGNAVPEDDKDEDYKEGIAFRKYYDKTAMTVTARIAVSMIMNGRMVENYVNSELVAGILEDGSNVDAGTYTAVITGLGGTLGANYTFDGIDDEIRAMMSVRYRVLKETYNMSGVTFEDKEKTYDGIEETISIKGNLPTDVTVSYTTVYLPYTDSAVYPVGTGSTATNGGVNAGTYKVTATFTGDYVNYEVIDSMEATLTIYKKDYVLDYGSFKDTSYSYDPYRAPVDDGDVTDSTLSAYKPVIADENLQIFEATYVYEELDVETNEYKSGITNSGKVWNASRGRFESDPNSFYDSGNYSVTAYFDFIKSEGSYTAESVLNSNNYNIPEPKQVFYNIGLPNIQKIVATYTPDETKTYKVGDTFDRGNLIVNAYYNVTVGGTTELRSRALNDKEYDLYYNRYGMQGEHPQFMGTFLSVGNRGNVALLVYYGGVGITGDVDGENGFTVRVNKGTISVEDVNIVNRHEVYDGKLHLPTVTGVPEGVNVFYTIDGDESGEVYREIYETDDNDQVILPLNLIDGVKNAGNYTFTVHFVVEDTDNYENITTEFKATVKLDPKVLNLTFTVPDHSGLGASEELGGGMSLFAAGEEEEEAAKIVYDGRAYFLVVEGDFVAGDINREFEVDLEFAINAGTYTSTVTGIYNGDVIDTNYQLPTINYYQWTIEQREVEIEFVEESFTFNGEEQAVSVLLDNLVAGEEVTAEIRYGGLVFKDARRYTATVVGLKLDGERATNYKLPAGDLSKEYTIAARQVYTSWYVSGYRVTDDDNAVALAFTNNSLFGSITVNMYYSDDPAYTPAHFSESGVNFIRDEEGNRVALTLASNQGTFINRGTYVITASCADTNYVLLDNDMNFVVEAAEREVTWYISRFVDFSSKTRLTSANGDPVKEYEFDYTGSKVYFMAEFKTLDGTSTALFVNGATSAEAMYYQEDGYEFEASFRSSIHAGNYKLINPKLNVTVNKVGLSINWSELTYNGSEQTLTGTVVGTVGAKPVNIDEATITGNKGTNAGEYTVNFKLTSEVLGNYYLIGDSGSSDGEGGYNYTWNIAPKALDVDWGLNPVYGSKNTTYDDYIPAVTIKEGYLATGDSVKFTYEIKNSADEVLTSYSTVTGDIYTITLTGTDNDNYTVEGMPDASRIHPYRLVAAAPTVEVHYNEYPAEGVDYTDVSFTETKLRNEKIVFTSVYGEEEIEGTVTFDNDILTGETPVTRASAGQFGVDWTFKPAVRYGQNYAEVTGTLVLMLTANEADHIVADTTGAIKPLNEYRVGDMFMPAGIVLYKAYKNYYEEDGTYYGRRDEMSTNNVTYWQNGRNVSVSSTVQIENASSPTQTIEIREYNALGTALLATGTIEIFVTSKDISYISVRDAKTDYFEGQYFDLSKLQIKVTYVDGTEDYFTGAEGISVYYTNDDKVTTRALATTDVALKAKYYDKVCSVNIIVKPKVNLVLESPVDEDEEYVTYYIHGETVPMAYATLNGNDMKPLTANVIGGAYESAAYTVNPEYVVTTLGGDPVSYSASGDGFVLPAHVGVYRVTVTVTEDRLSDEAKAKYIVPASPLVYQINITEVPTVEILVTIENYTYGDEDIPDEEVVVKIAGTQVTDVPYVIRYASSLAGPYDITTRPKGYNTANYGGAWYVKGFVLADGESEQGGEYKAGETPTDKIDSFVIAKATLTVKIADMTVPDDIDTSTIPANFNGVKSITGWKYDDEENADSIIAGTLELECEGYDKDHLHAGHNHTITKKSGTTGYIATNYTFTYVAGTFSITDHAAGAVTLKGDSTYKITEIGETKVVTGIVGTYGNDFGNTVENIKSQFEGEVKILDADGNELGEGELVGTGCKVVLPDGSAEVTVIIAGDVSGDGLVDAEDIFLAELHATMEYEIEDPILLAALDIAGDYDEDGKSIGNGIVDAEDIFLLELHATNDYSIYS